MIGSRQARANSELFSSLLPSSGHTGIMKSTAVVLSLVGAHHASGFVVDPAIGALARARVRYGASTVEMSAAPKLVPFSKYQGLGNDFILVDNREAEEPMLTAGESADLCDRCVGNERCTCVQVVVSAKSKGHMISDTQKGHVCSRLCSVSLVACAGWKFEICTRCLDPVLG